MNCQSLFQILLLLCRQVFFFCAIHTDFTAILLTQDWDFPRLDTLLCTLLACLDYLLGSNFTLVHSHPISRTVAKFTMNFNFIVVAVARKGLFGLVITIFCTPQARK